MRDGVSFTIRRASTAEQVADELRATILDGRLRPGDRIVESSLAARVGVSRNTLREALRALVREGLVTHQPHRGAVVTQLSEEDVAEIYRVRRILETTALAAAEGAAPETLAGLEEAATELEDAVERGDWARATEQDLLFHRRLVALLGSLRLETFAGGLLSELRLGLAAVDRYDGRAAMAEEHRRLLALARRGRSESARRLLLEDLARGEESLRRIVREAG